MGSRRPETDFYGINKSMKDMNIKLLPLAALCAALSFPTCAFAQKKPLDHDVYDSWQSVSGVKMSDDGKVTVWNVNPQEGDGTLYIRTVGESRQTSIPRGYQPTISPDGRWVVCRIKPEFAKTRKERIDKKKKDDQSKDSLAVIDITTMSIKKFANVESYSS